MNYKNAKDVFPKEILDEIQKYAAGQLVYFSNEEKSKSWGSVSGKKRNVKEKKYEYKK